ncbi:TetR family transcriptional regulator [Micromonospora pisi]|uniref:TetR family transcriptional regulator n=1 Tax=Micromonospora pisi TaxID=589240 RepID=A0A495JEZ6_9ACTN|nr:TetR/AcrR family transcriptional regulator [Micromonospora pisi]RKR87433.1 TetR family transcriptional regulator [Micromonospora pisi]
MPKQQSSRRAEYAENTREGIVEAARQLFTTQGYFATRVNDIAELARVAPATVYAVTGGKQGLLRTLTDIWSDAPIVTETLDLIARIEDPEEIIRIVARVTRQMREEFGDIMRMVIATAPHETTAAESLALATQRWRHGNATAARRIHELGKLRAGVPVEDAIDSIWFYFGYSAMSTLVDDNGWSYDRAQEWLTEHAIRDLL